MMNTVIFIVLCSLFSAVVWGGIGWIFSYKVGAWLFITALVGCFMALNLIIPEPSAKNLEE